MSDQKAYQKLVARASAELSKSVMTLLLEEPFFGHLLSGINRSVSDSTSTAAVGIRSDKPILIINPKFFATSLRKFERVAVVKHECLHLVLKHLFRGDHRDPLLANIAADIVVNQLIGKKWKLPEGAITLRTFPTLYLPSDQTFEWYYDKLHGARNKIDFAAICGSSPSDHSHWTEIDATNDKASKASQTLANNEIARLCENAKVRSSKSWGSIPNQLRGLIDAFIEEANPTVDWRRELRMFSNSSRRTRLKNSLKRPSKRYGTYPGLKVKRLQRMLIAIDTSGSITDQDLASFFAEIKGMWRQGAEITIVECDYAEKPTVDPKTNMLWLLTEDSDIADDFLPFGRTVKLRRPKQ